MIAAAATARHSARRFSPRSWGASFLAACGLTLLIALLLALAHRPPHYETELEARPVLSVQTIDLPPQAESASASAPASSDFRSLLPPAATPAAPPIRTQAPPLETSMELSQMIQWRYGYADLSQTSQATGSFGQSNLSSLDGGLETIIIPPESFPERLIDAGIFKGNVVVSLLINTDGKASVTHVHGASHPELIDPVVKSMNRAIYSVPEKDGRPTSTLIRRNVIFQADAKRIKAHQSKTAP